MNDPAQPVTFRIMDCLRGDVVIYPERAMNDIGPLTMTLGALYKMASEQRGRQTFASVAAIAECGCVSVRSARRHLDGLRQAGYVRHLGRDHRRTVTFKLTPKACEALSGRFKMLPRPLAKYIGQSWAVRALAACAVSQRVLCESIETNGEGMVANSRDAFSMREAERWTGLSRRSIIGARATLRTIGLTLEDDGDPETSSATAILLNEAFEWCLSASRADTKRTRNRNAAAPCDGIAPACGETSPNGGQTQGEPTGNPWVSADGNASIVTPALLDRDEQRDALVTPPGLYGANTGQAPGISGEAAIATRPEHAAIASSVERPADGSVEAFGEGMPKAFPEATPCKSGHRDSVTADAARDIGRGDDVEATSLPVRDDDVTNSVTDPHAKVATDPMQKWPVPHAKVATEGCKSGHRSYVEPLVRTPYVEQLSQITPDKSGRECSDFQKAEGRTSGSASEKHSDDVPQGERPAPSLPSILRTNKPAPASIKLEISQTIQQDAFGLLVGACAKLRLNQIKDDVLFLHRAFAWAGTDECMDGGMTVAKLYDAIDCAKHCATNNPIGYIREQLQNALGPDVVRSWERRTPPLWKPKAVEDARRDAMLRDLAATVTKAAP